MGKKVSSLAACAALAGGMLLVSGAGASADTSAPSVAPRSSCPDHRPVHPNLSSDVGVVKSQMYLHTDPYGACPAVVGGYAHLNDKLAFWCWIDNGYQNVWVWVRDASNGSVQGWISADAVTNAPSTSDLGTECPSNGL
jgi:hypothetical protein